MELTAIPFGSIKAFRTEPGPRATDSHHQLRPIAAIVTKEPHKENLG